MTPLGSPVVPDVKVILFTPAGTGFRPPRTWASVSIQLRCCPATISSRSDVRQQPAEAPVAAAPGCRLSPRVAPDRRRTCSSWAPKKTAAAGSGRSPAAVRRYPAPPRRGRCRRRARGSPTPPAPATDPPAASTCPSSRHSRVRRPTTPPVRHVRALGRMRRQALDQAHAASRPACRAPRQSAFSAHSFSNRAEST